MKQKSNLARCYVVSLSKIDAVEEYISSLIQNKQENEFVDFKQFYYHEDKKYDLIKDIVSFSNEVTSVDKYIVFGIINGSWEPAGIDLSTMPDVSVINDLLHTYVEPFIYVEIGQMKYNGKDLGYIKIPVDRADRPYVIKKEYSKHGKTYLRYGEIYVRKGANNFIATRRDLDHIYRNNGAFLISVFDSTVDIGFVQIRNERKLFIQVRTILANNTSHSINICGGVCDISTSRNTAQYECIYCEDRTRKFSNVPSIISTVPLSFSSGMELQKSLYFSISAESSELLLRKQREGDDFRNNYVDFDKTPSSTTYGNETYYGQDFLLKTSSGKLFVFNAPYPFPNKDNIAVFKKEKANIEHYFNIGAYVRLIEDFESDLYEGAVVPIALAQKYTAISLQPGGKILDVLAQTAIKQ